MVEFCKDELMKVGINPASTIEYQVNGEIYTLSLQWVIEAYSGTSERTQKLFVDSFKEIIVTNTKNIEKFFEDMGQLVLMTSLSENELES